MGANAVLARHQPSRVMTAMHIRTIDLESQASPSSVASLATKGVVVRQCGYGHPPRRRSIEKSDFEDRTHSSIDAPSDQPGDMNQATQVAWYRFTTTFGVVDGVAIWRWSY